jgi:hypothetical protein
MEFTGEVARVNGYLHTKFQPIPAAGSQRQALLLASFVYDSSYAAIVTISFPTLYTHPFFLSFSFVSP